MDKVHTVHVFETWSRSSGFGSMITDHTRMLLPDGGEAIESQYGTIQRIDGSEKIATSMNDARQLIIDELYRRIGIIREQISELRTQILNEELEVQNG